LQCSIIILFYKVAYADAHYFQNLSPQEPLLGVRLIGVRRLFQQSPVVQVYILSFVVNI